MKIIAIMGSPHKGNGYKIIQKIESRLKTFDNIDFQYICLSDIQLDYCKGCFTCIARGEHLCPIKDDRAKIEAELLSSDGVILVSPGYAWNVSGLMKTFIDRFAYSLHRPKFFQQSLLLVVNGGSGLSKTLQSLSYTLGGSHKVGELAVLATPWEPTVKYARQVEQRIEKITKQFYQAIKDKKESPPSLGNMIWFQMFKRMAGISPEKLPADYEYYKDKEDYFYPTKISRVKKYLTMGIARLGVGFMKGKVVFK